MVVFEQDALEQVVWGLDRQRLQLQMFIQDWYQEQERLMEHAIRTCLEGQTSEITQKPLCCAATQNLDNPSRQESELEDRRQPSANGAVPREQANLSTKACQSPKDVPSSQKCKIVSEDGSELSEFHEAASRGPGLSNLTDRQESRPEGFRQPSAHGAVAREQSNLFNEAPQPLMVEYIAQKQPCLKPGNSQRSRVLNIGSSQPPIVGYTPQKQQSVKCGNSQHSELLDMSSGLRRASYKKKIHVHSAIGLGEQSFAQLSSATSSADQANCKVIRNSLYSDTPTFESGRETSSASGLSILTCIVTSSKFESLCAAVIFANSVVMGIAADYAMAHLNGQDSGELSILELCFSIFYTVEVVLRIAVYGKTFFTGNLWKWNVFDLILILLSGYDRVQSAIVAKGTAAQNLSILRMLRLFKMLRLLRMFRLMKFFRELRLILAALLGSVQAMLWAGVLVVLISYMVAIGLLQGCAGYLEDGEVDINTERGIREYWPSVGRSMISLVMCTTGGKDWSDVAAPLEEVGTFFYGLFLAYMSFFIFAVLNTITSLFVDAIMENSSRDQQMVIQMELEKKHQYIAKLRAFFERIDEDGDGTVSYSEFLRSSDDPVLEAFAKSLDLDISSSKLFFKIISNDGVKDVDVETFVVGCIKLKGQARNMDLMDLIHTTKDYAARQEALTNEVLHLVRELTRNTHGGQSSTVMSCVPAHVGSMTTSPSKQQATASMAVQGTQLLECMLQLQKRVEELFQRQPKMLTLNSCMEMLPPGASPERLDKNVMAARHCPAQSGSQVALKPTERPTQPRGDNALSPRKEFGNNPWTSNVAGLGTGGWENACLKLPADAQSEPTEEAFDNAPADRDGPSTEGQTGSPKLGQQQLGQP